MGKDLRAVTPAHSFWFTGFGVELLFQKAFSRWNLVGNIVVIIWKIRLSTGIRAKALGETILVWIPVVPLTLLQWVSY